MGEPLGSQLNGPLMDLFDKKIATGILATVNQDATPHTTPVNFMMAADPKHIRIALARVSTTLANIRLHEPVMLALLEEGNIAVSIKGNASVIKENMEVNFSLAVVELVVEEVKNDASVNFLVVQGIRTRHNKEMDLLQNKRIFAELASL